VALACHGTLSSQTVVDPNGGGHYRDLQTAIDAVPAGTVIKVIGGSYSSLRIGKSLTIIGAPTPTIASPLSGTGIQPPAITLAGSGTERLTLDNLRIGGPASGASWNQAGAGIQGGGFEHLRVTRSHVSGHFYTVVTGDARGAPAIRLQGGLSVHLVLSQCTVDASHSLTDNTNSWGYDGPAAIDTSVTVILLDTTVTGGDGTDSVWAGWTPTPNPCPCPGAMGAGGAGVVAGAVFESASQVTGGKGGEVRYHFGGPFYSWGRQPDGPAYVVPTRRHIASTIATTMPALLGRTWEVRIYFGRDSAVLLGDLATSPMPVLRSWLFVDPTRVYLVAFVPGTASRVTFPLPNEPSLAGLPLALQLAEPSGLSRPLFSVIGF
jgi:hypothetical protein